MRAPELRRTTTFRLTTVYGAVFALAVVLLLGLVYWRTASALSGRVDGIVRSQASALARSDAAGLPAAIAHEEASSAGRLNAYGLFSQDGLHVAGRVSRLPRRLIPDGPIRDVSFADGFPFPARALAVRLPWGEVLVASRDTNQIREVRRIMLGALGWSGALIAGLGLASGVVLSLAPLQRLRALQAASQRIMAGDLATRMPDAGLHDELDLFAGMVNAMIEEVARLLAEAKNANDSVAHDLRTPLARVRGLLLRIQGEEGVSPAALTLVEHAILELDRTLDRFRALLRISEIEAQARRAGFRPVTVADVLRQAAELYEPLAEARGVRLRLGALRDDQVEADDKLLFEAVSNLIDNAIKFSDAAGEVTLEMVRGATWAGLRVADRGPGIPPEEGAAVLERFYRGAQAGPTAGSGLGLSIVAAIARLHRFELRLEENSPGLRATLSWPME